MYQMQQSTYDGYVANMGYSTNKVTIETGAWEATVAQNYNRKKKNAILHMKKIPENWICNQSICRGKKDSNQFI